MKFLIQLLLFSSVSTMVNAQFPEREIDSLLLSIYPPADPGAAIAIMHNGKILFKKGYGIADLNNKKKITSVTNFNIGSITKQFTAMAILQLLGEKKISLNETLGRFFPDFNAKVGSIVTVKQMLSHNSAILDHYEYTDTTGLRHATDRNVLKAVKNLDSVYFPPGTQYRYSNTAYCLLALIVEKVSGISFSEYIQMNIFNRAGMKQSAVWCNGRTIPYKATGYDFDSASKAFKQWDADENVFFSTQGDGGIYTSIDEYLKWFSAIQNPKLFNDSLVKMARSIQFPIRNRLGYGYGWFVENSEPNLVAYHTGSNGGFRSITYSLPEENYVMVIFSNRTGIDLEKLTEKINKLVRIHSKPVTKVEPYVSFQVCWPIFAPCKKIPLFLSSLIKNWSVSGMELN